MSGSTQGNGIAYSAGYADWGTRLKAVFSNVPSGVALFVSATNLNSSDSWATGPAPAWSLRPRCSSFAALITSETSPDSGGVSGAGNTSTSSLPLVTQTGTTTSSVIAGNVAAYPIGYAPLTVVNGTASAVWEVVNSLPNTPENFDFEVFMTVTSNVGFQRSTRAQHHDREPELRANRDARRIHARRRHWAIGYTRYPEVCGYFHGHHRPDVPNMPDGAVVPYVINVAGFDTGLSIANTSQDPFGDFASSGICSVYWYGQSGSGRQSRLHGQRRLPNRRVPPHPRSQPARSNPGDLSGRSGL